jgi:hypothetical protein
MKPGIIFIHGIFLAASCSAQESIDAVDRGESQLIIDNLKKNVNSFEIRCQLQANVEKLVEKVWLTPGGKLKRVEIYDDNGAKDITETFLYDDTFLVKRTSTSKQKADSWVETFTYDWQTKRIKKVQASNGYGRITFSEDYRYRNDSLFFNYKDAVKDLSYREVRVYKDSSYKTLISVSRYEPNALIPSNSAVFQYNSNNQLVKEIFKSSGGLFITDLYEYDASGQKVKSTSFYEDTSVKSYSCFMRYDKSLLVKECFDYGYSDSSAASIETYIVDDNRLFLMEKISFADTSTDDPQRLSHGRGLQLLYNDVGISALIRINEGKIEKKYLVKYIEMLNVK